MTAPGHKLHPSREELVCAISEGNILVRSHLAECDDCRALHEYLTAFPVMGKARLVEAPERLVRQAERIFQDKSLLSAAKELAAVVLFDSWNLPAPVGVRTAGATSDRRLRFACEQLQFDLRVELSGQQWHCIGRVTGAGFEASHYRVEIHNRPVELNEDGFYQWSAAVPPKHVRLRSDELVINLPEITWKPRPRN